MPASPPNPTAESFPIEWPALKQGTPRRKDAVRRRPTPQQGRALEILGHAVEYLVDSRLHLHRGVAQSSDELAVQLLMRLNREVFADCPQIVPVHLRLRRWLRW